jgi:hypothetical protein
MLRVGVALNEQHMPLTIVTVAKVARIFRSTIIARNAVPLDYTITCLRCQQIVLSHASRTPTAFGHISKEHGEVDKIREPWPATAKTASSVAP